MQKRYKENIKEKKQTTVTTTLSATASSRLRNISTISQICAFTAAKIPFNSIDQTEVRHTRFFLANLEMVGQFRNQQEYETLD